MEYATIEAMKAHAGESDVRVGCQVCPEVYSATPGDYFWLAPGKPLTCCGEPCVLVRRVPESYHAV